MQKCNNATFKMGSATTPHFQMVNIPFMFDNKDKKEKDDANCRLA